MGERAGGKVEAQSGGRTDGGTECWLSGRAGGRAHWWLNELVLQTKTGAPEQLWKFKDGLLMNKTGLVAECKPRGFPKWWQVRSLSKDIKEQ